MRRAVTIAGTATVSGTAPELPLANPRARKMMSRAAYLAARGLADLVRDTGWDPAPLGYYLGVGASGGSLDEFMALLGESLVDGALSLPRFGDRGLAACNPLLAFQLMNNFTLCHAAIQERLGGPNAALFSRGAGTVAALAEAVHAVRSGDCDRAIAGGADAPSHPATIAELTREGFIARGLAIADGAAMVALEVASRGSIVVEGCAHASGRARSITDALDDAYAHAGAGSFELAVISTWGPPADAAVRSWLGGVPIVSTAALGESLAASPALAVVAAAELIAPGQRVIVAMLGVDGDPGVVILARGAA